MKIIEENKANYQENTLRLNQALRCKLCFLIEKWMNNNESQLINRTLQILQLYIKGHVNQNHILHHINLNI
jgi:hypothetical protein